MNANAQRAYANTQALRGDMQNMGIHLQTQMKAGQEEMKVELVKVRGEMQTMGQNFANGIRTEHGGMTESRESVEVVRTAMTTGVG